MAMALDETMQAVASALEGAVYPLTRRQLVLVARANEAPRTLLSLLEGIPDATFRSLEDVQLAISPLPSPPPDPDLAPPLAGGRPPASR